LLHDRLVIAFVVDLVDKIGEDDDVTNNAAFTLLRRCLLEATPPLVAAHCFI
jgi:hypothetical protein